MNPPTYEDFLADPDAVLAQVELAAHRERAQAVHELIVTPLMHTFKRLSAKGAEAVQPQSA